MIPNTKAEIWSRVKVITLTGWEYDNMTIETIPNASYIVIINPDGATKKMSRSNISIILDENGKDITSIVLVNPTIVKTAPDDTTAISELTPNSRASTEIPSMRPNEDYRTIRQRSPSLIYGARHRFSISGGSGYSLTVGDWFEGLTNGLSFNACGRLTLTNNIYIGFSYRYQSLGVDSELEGSYIIYDEYGNPVAIVSVDFDVYLNEIYGLIGFMTDPSTYTKPFAFFEVGFGGIDHNIKATASDGSNVASVSTDETKFGMLMTVGGVFPFNKTIGLCLEGNMRITGEGNSYSYNYYQQGSTGVLFGAGISLVIMVGK